MLEEKKINNSMQNILMENRQRLNISGVIEVVNFDDETICVNTELGLLTVKGQQLKVNKLNLDNTELLVEGQIGSLMYSENYSKSGFFQKLFK
ncbi:MAG: sporulation protein YabP [Clostridiales bacterium]|nr:sporulation protein YabP [Clostridiales bacterium]